MADLHVVVLAAGKGTRLRSSQAKVLHSVLGVPMVELVLRAAMPLGPDSVTVVIGYQGERVREALAHHDPRLHFVVQEPQLGTAHALLQAESGLAGLSGTLLLLSGDVPLLRTSTLERLLQAHHGARAAATLLTFETQVPQGYGRIVRDGAQIARIIEERDASEAERAIREVNGGIYAFDLDGVFDLLHQIDDANAQSEYYLPDLVALYRQRGQVVYGVRVENASEVKGINSRKELAEVHAMFSQMKNDELMALGVTIEDPPTTFVGPDVVIGPDTVLHPNVILEGRTRIGARCEVHAGVRIVNTVLEDEVVVSNFCLIVDSHLGRGVVVGPFAHLRPGSVLHERAKIGNFVEVKNTTVGRGSKANHLSYLGDATLGEHVNIGAGTITCNYDGEQKHPTTIEDGVFIGSDTQLIAPVRIGRGAYVAAGSSIVEDVPAESLAIARARQVNKTGWVAKKKGAKTQ